MSSVWSLIKDGHYSDACLAADNEYTQNQDVFVLRNKVLALLNLGHLEAATGLSAFIIKATKGDTDSDYIFLGVAYWLLNKHTDAIASWKAGSDAEYTDAAGGVEIPSLLYYAATRLNDTPLAKESIFRLQSKYNKSVTTWPLPLVGYILGRVSSEEVMLTTSSNLILKAKQQCQAFFHFGVRNLSETEVEKARINFRKATETGSVSLAKHEYYLAKHECAIIEEQGQASQIRSQ